MAEAFKWRAVSNQPVGRLAVKCRTFDFHVAIYYCVSGDGAACITLALVVS